MKEFDLLTREQKKVKKEIMIEERSHKINATVTKKSASTNVKKEVATAKEGKVTQKIVKKVKKEENDGITLSKSKQKSKK